MKEFLFAVLGLTLAACGAPKAPDHGAQTDMPAASTSANDVSLASLQGRWGVTMAACAATNSARDGVVEIGPEMVQIGLDRCAITSQTSDKPAADVVGFDVKAQCKGGEGEDYAGAFRFVTSTGGETMTLVMKDGGAEPYSRCR